MIHSAYIRLVYIPIHKLVSSLLTFTSVSQESQLETLAMKLKSLLPKPVSAKNKYIISEQTARCSVKLA